MTQADLDAGHYANTACVDDGAGGAAQQCATKNVPAVQGPTLSITKAATETSFNAVGQVLHYTIVATNVGNTSLAAVTVTDPGVSGLTCTPANGSALAPGASMTCTATHLVTQADLDAGQYANTACVDDGLGGAAQQCASKDVPAVQGSTLSVTKVAAESSFDAVGQTLHYTIVATNVGNTTLAAVTVTDPGVIGLSCVPANGSGLAPGASMTCTATHLVTQADLDAGHYANQACVDDGPGGAARVCASRDVAGTATPAITLTKSAAPKTYEAVGQVITYTLVATNTGTVTLSNVSIADPKLGSLTCTPAQPTTLAPGAKLSCNGSHTIGQGDLDAGHYANTATATGTSPTGGVSITASEDVTATPPPTPPVADANIQISPSAATNPVGTNHTLSGHVNVNARRGLRERARRDGDHLHDHERWRGERDVCRREHLHDPGHERLLQRRDQLHGSRHDHGPGATDVTVNGIALHRETDAAATNSAAATKSWADATARTDILNANGNVVTTVQAGTIVHDKAFVARTAATPASLANPTGTVVFHRYTTGDCTGTPTDQTVTLTVGQSVDRESRTASRRRRTCPTARTTGAM